MTVSVIMTCHNEERYIEQAIRSVVAQTAFAQVEEIIVVNDGSQDGSSVVLEKLQAEIDKLLVLDAHGIGPAAARNLALSQAKGEAIAFLDGDDFWTPEKLHSQLQALSRNPRIGLVYSDYMDISQDDATDAKYVSVRRFQDESTNQLSDYFINDAPIMTSTTLIRRRVFDEIGLFDESLRTSEDTELFLRLAEQWRFCYVTGAFLFKRRRTGQLTERLDRLLPNAARVTREFAERHPELARLSGRRMARFHAKVSMDCARRDERRQAIHHAFTALQLAPLFWRAWATFLAVIIPAALSRSAHHAAQRLYHASRHSRIGP